MLLDLVYFNLLEVKATFNKKLPLYREFDIKKPALFLKSNLNIWIFHRLQEVIKLISVILFILLEFNFLLILHDWLHFLVLQKKRCIYFDAMFAFPV